MMIMKISKSLISNLYKAGEEPHADPDNYVPYSHLRIRNKVQYLTSMLLNQALESTML